MISSSGAAVEGAPRMRRGVLVVSWLYVPHHCIINARGVVALLARSSTPDVFSQLISRVRVWSLGASFESTLPRGFGFA